jgi:hypothetical protein
MSKHPECDKMLAVADKSQAIGEFLEWMGPEKGLHLGVVETRAFCSGWRSNYCKSGRSFNYRDQDVGECRRCGGTGEVELSTPRLVPASYSIERLLAEFFKIDLDKVDAERRAILEALRR